MGGIKKRKPLHPCEGCGTMVGALKKRCGPCSATRLEKQRLTNLRKRRERLKEAKKNEKAKQVAEKAGQAGGVPGGQAQEEAFG